MSDSPGKGVKYWEVQWTFRKRFRGVVKTRVSTLNPASESKAVMTNTVSKRRSGRAVRGLGGVRGSGGASFALRACAAARTIRVSRVTVRYARASPADRGSTTGIVLSAQILWNQSAVWCMTVQQKGDGTQGDIISVLQRMVIWQYTHDRTALPLNREQLT